MMIHHHLVVKKRTSEDGPLPIMTQKAIESTILAFDCKNHFLTFHSSLIYIAQYTIQINLTDLWWKNETRVRDGESEQKLGPDASIMRFYPS